MTERILQLGLLAQDDAGRWMNILFIVVVAVFWAIGGLVKVASNKSRKQGASRPSDGRKRETWLRQLAKKAQDIQHALRGKAARSSRIPYTDLKSNLSKQAAPQRGALPLTPIEAIVPL